MRLTYTWVFSRVAANKSKLSVIIPTLNEEGEVGKLLRHLQAYATLDVEKEYLVADAGSTDKTHEEARAAGATVVEVGVKRKSIQLNQAALYASGSILCFFHADSYPPYGWDRDIIHYITPSTQAACWRLAFSRYYPFLQVFRWFTRFPHQLFRGGDAGLAITSTLFTKLGGYDERLTWMEDVEIIKRAKKGTHIQVIPRSVLTSVRKYEENGVVALQTYFALIQLAYYLGGSPSFIKELYRAMIGWSKGTVPEV